MDSFLNQHADILRNCLEDVDLFTKENVASGRGGPFGARLALFTIDKEGRCSPQIQFPVSCNMVLETGIGSFHAEAQALNPGHTAILKQKIRQLAFDTKATPIVVLFSSAQPCMACQTKIEIFARHLVHDKLIQPKNFLLVYGAHYDETEKIAGFHDYAYALDFFNFHNNENTKYNLITHEDLPLDNLPPEIHNVLSNNALIEAVLVREGRVIGLGYDQRTENDFFNTAECAALHAASRDLKNSGHETPWRLNGAHLYTLNEDIGPLSYAECQWAAVEKVVSISSTAAPQSNAREMNRIKHQHTKQLDCSDCTNSVLFQKISEGYNTPWSALTVIHDQDFANRGQKEWAQRMNRIFYNGHDTKNTLTMQDKQIFDSLFVPFSLIGTSASLELSD